MFQWCWVNCCFDLVVLNSPNIYPIPVEENFMLTHMLKGKLHMAKVTQAELWYDGSCAIDADLVALAGMREFEQIDIYNVNNGERFHTYIILAEPGSGTFSMNGA